MTSHEPEKSAEQILEEFLSKPPLWDPPESFEQDVLARIERIERRRRVLTFSDWPRMAQGAFVLGSLGITALSLGAVAWIKTFLASQFGWLGTLVEAAGLVSLGISHWLYPCAIGLLVVYCLLAGLGGTAYRTLRK